MLVKSFAFAMSGRRLLDAAAIYKASRSVASKYVALRKSQWENYSKTSSFAKAVKDQTDRVTLTVKAASALSERFNSTSPSYSTEAPQQRSSDPKNSIPSQESVQGADQIEKKQGLEQDHFYQRSERNSTTEPSAQSELDVKQEKAKRHPLPDGSIPPADAGTNIAQQQDVFSNVSRTEPPKSPLSEDKTCQDDALKPASSGRTSIPNPAAETEPSPADRARKLQRQAEKQIPSESAEPPTIAPSQSGSMVQGQDVFNTRPSETSQSLSGLPRVKLPKTSEDRQEGEKPVSDGQINQEVFYSSVDKDQKHAVPEFQAVSEQEQLPEDVYSEIFQSPRVARMLGAKPKFPLPGQGLDLRAQPGIAIEQTKLPQENDQESFNKRPTGQADTPSVARPVMSVNQETPRNANDEEIHQLAADLARESDSGAFGAEMVSLRKALWVAHELID